MSLAAITAKLQVKPTDDEYEAIETTRWGNRDIYPVAHDKRVYGIYDYVAYWVSDIVLWHERVKLYLPSSREHAVCAFRRGRSAAA